MILKELKLNNFISHEKTTIVFGENEKILLDGKSGSGKSSITDAVLWALYGKARVENHRLIRKGARGASVSLKLAEGDREVAITRTVSSTRKNTLVVTENRGTEGQFLPIETTGAKDTQAWIEKILLKASFELFTNSVAYPQENEKSFVKATASNRKNLLLEIVGAGNFDELYEKSRESFNKYVIELNHSEADIVNVSTYIQELENDSAKLSTYEMQYKKASADLIDLKEKKDKLESDRSEFAHKSVSLFNTRKMRDMHLSAIKDIDIALSKNSRLVDEHKKTDIGELTQVLERLEGKEKEAKKIEQELQDIALLQQQINSHLANRPQVFDYSKDIELLNKRLIPLLNESTSCPAGDDCPFVGPIHGQIEFITQQIEEKTKKGEVEQLLMEKWSREYASFVPRRDSTALYSQLTFLKLELEKLPEVKDTINQYMKFEETLKIIQSENSELLAKRTEQTTGLADMEKEIATLDEEVSQYNSQITEQNIVMLKRRIDGIEKEKDDALVNIATATNAEQSLVIENRKKDELESKIKTLRTNIDCLSALKDAFGSNGVKTVIIDYVVPQLEEKINAILGQMSDFKIRLDTQQAKADDDGVKEGLFITILNEFGEELPFASYSGGEKVKITIAISEALSSLMNSVGFRIMDENIVSLDKESTEGFISVLAGLQERYPQLIIISHLQEVKDMFGKQLFVKKINGVSSVQT